MATHMTKRGHAVRALTLVVAVYFLARMADWTGPNSRMQWDWDLMLPAIVLITLWGIARLARRW